MIDAPKNYKAEDGTYISNFNKSEEVMSLFGFKRVLDQPPTYNESSEFLSVVGYEELQDEIKILYEVVKLDSQTEAFDVVEEIEKLRSEVTDQEKAISAVYDIILRR